MNSQLVRKLIPGSRHITESLVDSNVEEEEMVCNMIHETLPQLEVKEILTVENTFLEGMYLLKKEEYKSRHRKVPEEKLLFHVSAASNVKNIILNNFDWRRISRGKFGLGTSFSGDAEYANCYANFNIGEDRAIIVTKVLVSKTIAGQNGMEILRRKFDTAVGNGDKVYVKFYDSEMLPKCVVYYNSNFSKTNKKNKEVSIKKKPHFLYETAVAKTSKSYSEEVFDNSYEYDEYKYVECRSGEHDDEYGEEESDYKYVEYQSGEYDDEYGEEEEESDYEDVYDEDCEEEEFCEEEDCEDEYDDEESYYEDECDEDCEEEEFSEEECGEEEGFEEEEGYEDEEGDYEDEDCEDEEDYYGEEEDEDEWEDENDGYYEEGYEDAYSGYNNYYHEDSTHYGNCRYQY